MTTAMLLETRDQFACFGGRASIAATGDERTAAEVAAVRRLLERWHDTLTRFDPLSELSLLNSSPQATVRASETMCRFVSAAIETALLTDGLVDPTLCGEIESAGYRTDLGRPLDLTAALAAAPARAAATPNPASRWRELSVDPPARTVTRPPGVRLDSGGIAKGLCADTAAELLAGSAGFAIDACGDIRLGGGDGLPRAVRVDDPFGRGVLHEFELHEGGVAPSGIGRRSWIGPGGAPAHHLLDPATGRPAWTGVVQATALAPTAAEAEARAKAAVLSGPDGARRWLAHGGVIVFDDGSHVTLNR